MMMQPRRQTDEEIIARNRLFEAYEYYGIPYGVFDSTRTPENVEKDWSRAVALLAKKEKIPKELENRLLKYKEQRSKMNRNS